MGLAGKLSGDIGGLTELKSLSVFFSYCLESLLIFLHILSVASSHKVIEIMHQFDFRDLSFNKELTGSLSPQIGDLQKLNIL